jgi:hypothetical protein
MPGSLPFPNPETFKTIGSSHTGMMISAFSIPSCAVCNKPLDFKNCTFDEKGKPVHRECYLASIKAAKKAS